MKPEIKLQTPQGDKGFPLVRQDIKTGTFEEEGARDHWSTSKGVCKWA
jgi:hypothetical protein